ncbi:MAG: hypothetical protein V9F01_03190 [Chitinophagaceae bacterium]
MVINLAPAPDFRVDSVFAPASTFSGSTVNLTYKVKNYGVVTPAYSSWTDSVFMSQSPLFDRSNAIPLYSPKTNGSYYPNAKEATVFNDSLQVLPDSYVLKEFTCRDTQSYFWHLVYLCKSQCKRNGSTGV